MLTKFAELISKVRIKSITDSLFKYMLFLFALAGIFSVFKAETWLVIVVCCSGIAVLLLAIVFYCYHSVKNPDYLRSETFQLKKQSIEMLGDKENIQNPNIINVIKITTPTVEGYEETKNLNEPE